MAQLCYVHFCNVYCDRKLGRNSGGVKNSRCETSITHLMFTFHHLLNDLIRLIKEGCGDDGFLQWPNVFLLMDGTGLLSTTRANTMRKVSLLEDYCT